MKKKVGEEEMVMATKRMKRRREEEEDRLSDLPDLIIHHIFSFLPTMDAVRMNTLSKCWMDLRVLDLNTSLNFSESAQFQKEKFQNLVSCCLKLQNLDRLQSFKLKMRFYGVYYDHSTLMTSYYRYGSDDKKPQIDGWLKTIMDRSNGLKEMNICIKPGYRDIKYCFISNNVLHSNSLAVLKLGYVKLECVRSGTVSHVELPSLKALSLKNVYLDYMTLKNLLIGCPSIEDLVLHSCHGLEKVVVSCSSLKSFIIRYPRNPIHNVDEGRSIQVEAVNLDTFVYDGAFVCKANIDIGGCGRVRSVRVLKAELNHDKWLDDLLNLQVESLTLDHCAGFKQINIRNPYLKVLDLGGYAFHSYRCKGAVQATNIDTLNLVSFSCEFQGKIVPNFSVNAPTLLEPCIKLVSKEAYTTDWYVNLIYFLKNFNGFKGLSLNANKEVCIKFSQSISIMLFASLAILIVFCFLPFGVAYVGGSIDPKDIEKCLYLSLTFCPLPTEEHLKVTFCPLPTEEHLKVKSHSRKKKILEKRSVELREALLWLTPSVETPIIQPAGDNFSE